MLTLGLAARPVAGSPCGPPATRLKPEKGPCNAPATRLTIDAPGARFADHGADEGALAEDGADRSADPVDRPSAIAHRRAFQCIDNGAVIGGGIGAW